MAKIILDHLSKHWKDDIVVDQISLEIKESEFFVLLGPSGCGKTTTLRMIAGLEEITSGKIYIGKRCVNHLLPKDRDIAMVFQNYGLYPHMSVRNNIAYPLKMRKIPPEQHDDLILKAAKKVEMSEYLDKKPQHLSGGQRQRVALARAIVRQPTCFLMDEPLSNLDAKLRISTRGEIKHLQKELQITTLYVTHDQIEAMTMADRVAIMNQGKITQLGTPQEIYNRPQNTFVAGFIGSPPMNLVQGTIDRGVFQTENIRITGVKNLSDGEIYFGFRAEDASISFKKNNADGIKTEIHHLELLGDSTLVKVKINGEMISVKTNKDFKANPGDSILIQIPLPNCHFFNFKNGRRILTED